MSSQSYSEQVNGWTSMNKILLKRQLVTTVPGKRPLRYTLTDQGKELATILVKKYNIQFFSMESSCEETNRIGNENSDIYHEVKEWGQVSEYSQIEDASK